MTSQGSQGSTRARAPGPWPFGLDQWGTPVVPPKPNLGFFLRVLEEGLEGEAWPTGLDWDYRHSHKCALALYRALWPESCADVEEIAKKLGVDYALASEAFFFLIGPDNTMASVTPQQVAKALRA